MIRVEGLSKSFGDIRAVDDVTLEVRDGEIFGLLGPNGAGKTTLISMVSGVLEPEAGRVLVDGEDIWVTPKKVKRMLGVVPQELAVYEDLSARDNLDFWASLHGLSGREKRRRVDASLSRVGLIDRARDRVRTFSGGMKRRLNLCMGLIHEPKFLLLDEPTVGIDPQARLSILDIVRDIAASGTTVLFTTHHMEEAEQVCERIAILDHGKILATGTLEELTRLAGEGEMIRVKGPFHDDARRERLAAIEGLELLSHGDDYAVASVKPAGPGLAKLLPGLLDGDLGVEDLTIQKPSLQSVFIRLTGRELRD